MKKLIIWDLDGTLLDTSKGIFNSVRYTEKKLGLQPVAEEQLRDWIGPKVIDSYLAHYDITQEQAELATFTHREYGVNHAIYEAEVYPNIVDLLNELKEKNIIQAVATMKPQEMAEKILEHFELEQYFSAIFGMDNDNKRTKTGNISLILSEFTIEPTDCLMIGDTIHDLHGAKEVNTSFLPIGYGYGFVKNEEMLFHGKGLKAVESVGELRRSLMNQLGR